jgi:hypothetical protein
MACGCGLFGGKHIHSKSCKHNTKKHYKKRKTYKAKGGFRYGKTKFGRTPTPGEQLVSSSRTKTRTKTRKSNRG